MEWYIEMKYERVKDFGFKVSKHPKKNCINPDFSTALERCRNKAFQAVENPGIGEDVVLYFAG
jgi:hypothetical protein